MLKQRIITGLSLLAPVLAVIFMAPTWVLFALFAAVSLLVAWEWTALMGLQARSARYAYVVGTAALLALGWLWRGHGVWVFAVATVWWLIALALLPGFPQNLERHKPGVITLGVLGQIMIVPAILSLAALHAMTNGPWVLLYSLVLVWAADVGAYFAGRALGKHKLAPKVSPGKSIEGAIGGLLLSLVLALVSCSFVFGRPIEELMPVLVLSLAVTLISIVGDLTESMFKRLSGLKDSGSILPGHGGLLDRADSLLAAMPMMALGLILIS